MVKCTQPGGMYSGTQDYQGYVADTFAELPADAHFGSQGIYLNDEDKVCLAIKFTEGWKSVNEEAE